MAIESTPAGAAPPSMPKNNQEFIALVLGRPLQDIQPLLAQAERNPNDNFELFAGALPAENGENAAPPASPEPSKKDKELQENIRKFVNKDFGDHGRDKAKEKVEDKLKDAGLTGEHLKALEKLGFKAEPQAAQPAPEAKPPEPPKPMSLAEFFLQAASQAKTEPAKPAPEGQNPENSGQAAPPPGLTEQQAKMQRSGLGAFIAGPAEKEAAKEAAKRLASPEGFRNLARAGNVAGRINGSSLLPSANAEGILRQFLRRSGNGAVSAGAAGGSSIARASALAGFSPINVLNGNYLSLLLG